MALSCPAASLDHARGHPEGERAPQGFRFSRTLGGGRRRSGGRALKLLLCDDHALFREGLGFVLREIDPAAELVEAVDADGALAAASTHPDLDLVLLDLALPGRTGLSALRELRALHPELPVAIVSATDDARSVREALAAGAMGFIPKASTGALLRGALQIILAGGVYVPPAALDAAADAAAGRAAAPGRRLDLSRLTPRQREVMTLVVRGLTNREIAEVLSVAEGTIKNHVAAILERLEITNRTEAAFVLSHLLDDPEA
jgi:DNA-binding NarL/FixJ family response regulator